MRAASRALLGLLAVSACKSSDTAKAGRLESVEQLATLWSAGHAKRTCQKLGPRGEPLGPRKEYCQWETVAHGSQRSTVGAYRDSSFGFTTLVWERTVVDSAERKRVVDSLDFALRDLGFVAWACPDEGRHWETETFKIELMSSPPVRRNHVMNTMAYRGAVSISELFCAPPASIRRKLAPRRTS